MKTFFKVGDVVRLKSGGPKMVVEEVFQSPYRSGWLRVHWYDSNAGDVRAAQVHEDTIGLVSMPEAEKP